MKGLPKCYLLHTDPSKFRELGKTRQATCFPLSTLNHWKFTKHTSWLSKPRLPKFPRWDSWAWIMSQKMRWCAMNLNHGLWHLFVWIWALLGFRRDFPKIHDNVDMVRVANDMKSCGVKNLSSTNTNQLSTYSRFNLEFDWTESTNRSLLLIFDVAKQFWISIFDIVVS